MTAFLASEIGALVADIRRPEGMVRTLLAALKRMSELDSVYVARYDERSSTVEVLFAQSDQRPAIVVPEGLVMRWQDTLCRRAFKDRIHFTEYADELWGDSNVVRHLGVQTFLSEPMRQDNGALFGTLCGISHRRVPVGDNTLRVFELFARLIAHQLELQERVATLEADRDRLARCVMTDPLTGIANRRGLEQELQRSLSDAARRGGRVAVVFIDLDRFKAINDRYGHEAGDQFLVAMAGRLAAATRAGERVARYGGDEFVVVATLDAHSDAERLGRRFGAVTRGDFVLGEQTIAYAGASVGTAVARPGETLDELLERADRAMFAAKQARHAAA